MLLTKEEINKALELASSSIPPPIPSPPSPDSMSGFNLVLKSVSISSIVYGVYLIIKVV